ncbi:hypothetical protein K431DRAFT_300488 [Polychaeton citri CBS 116435]|uniref:Mitochondrial adapter protein MCP1 transmembrane domain-containing protein n=1 Tax=Polychaeton citri CBS 116435 TaxID=1314669 RepID=A0A9P4UTT8_9PEZI|nr:hypothetical protein K431DRAFT_300488 [Polychaeton citri CBS 116435]
MADYDRDPESGLHVVDPSPVDETPPEAGPKHDGYFAAPKRTNTLGLSQHSAVWYLTRIQKYSSYAFSAFAVAHIANTSLVPLATQSVHASESYLLLTRPYYQGIPFEPLLVVIPLAAHIGSGLALRIYRRQQNGKRYGQAAVGSGKNKKLWPALSGTSKLGFALTWLTLGHAFINRGIPKQVTGGSSNINLSYVSHAFAKHPIVSYVGFSALITAGVWHVTWGWAKWLGLTPDQTTELGTERQAIKKRRWSIINGVSLLLTGLWMAGSFGIVGQGGEATGWQGRQYDELYRRIPIVGEWM